MLVLSLTYMFLYSLDSHNLCGVSCVHIEESLQNLNVLLNDCEYGDASCFVASETNNSVLFKIYKYINIKKTSNTFLIRKDYICKNNFYITFNLVMKYFV